MATCPLCGNFADVSLLAGACGGVRTAQQIDCEICGSFVAGWVFQQTRDSYPQETRFLLSAITRKATDEQRTVELTSDSARDFVANTPWPSSREQDTLFLDYIARNAQRRGDSVPVNHRKDYPRFFAKGEEEVNSIARELAEARYIRRTDTSALPRYTLTAKGREELGRRQAPTVAPKHRTITPAVRIDAARPKDFDLFLSHASEDKVAIADPLYERLTAAGCRVWYDKAVLTLGDSLRRKIAEGLRVSNYGIVILSPSFFAKNWPQQELDGLVAREMDEGRKILLPVWHNVTKVDVLKFSPPLADKVAVNSEQGIERVAAEIMAAIHAAAPFSSPPRTALSNLTAQQAEADAALRLEFIPGKEPFVCVRQVDPGPPFGHRVEWPWHRIFRVAIVNDGKVTTANARAILESVEPAPPDFSPSYALAFMDGGREFSLIPPGGRAVLDVVDTFTRKNPTSPSIDERVPVLRFHYANHPPADTACSATERILTLRVESGRSPVHGRYRLTFDATGQATMTEVPEDGATHRDEAAQDPSPHAAPSAPQPPSRPLDTVTGLPDKGAFVADLPAAVGAARHGAPLALIMVDADHFKEVNDTHGHPKGDEVLRGIAQRLQAAVVGKGTAYRWGGEEFAVLLLNHNVENATAVAERLRSAVAGAEITGVPVTVSVGVALLPDHAPNGRALLSAADSALYAAKRAGRNRVCLSGTPEPPDSVASRTQPGAGRPPAGASARLRLSRHSRIVGWIGSNKQWVFSGIGVFVLGLVVSGIFWLGDEWFKPQVPAANPVVTTTTVSSPPTPSPTPSPTAAPAKPPANAQPAPPALIYDFLIETRLHCAAPESGTLEESGAGSAREAPYLDGSAGYEELRLLQPVRVLRAGTTATLVNRFGMQETSQLRGRPTTFLLGFSRLSLPIALSPTTHWQCLSMHSYEATLMLNGREFWTQRQFIGKRPWQGAGGFDADLAPLHALIKKAKP